MRCECEWECGEVREGSSPGPDEGIEIYELCIIHSIIQYVWV